MTQSGVEPGVKPACFHLQSLDSLCHTLPWKLLQPPPPPRGWGAWGPARSPALVQPLVGPVELSRGRVPSSGGATEPCWGHLGLSSVGARDTSAGEGWQLPCARPSHVALATRLLGGNILGLVCPPHSSPAKPGLSAVPGPDKGPPPLESHLVLVWSSSAPSLGWALALSS